MFWQGLRVSGGQYIIGTYPKTDLPLQNVGHHRQKLDPPQNNRPRPPQNTLLLISTLPAKRVCHTRRVTNEVLSEAHEGVEHRSSQQLKIICRIRTHTAANELCKVRLMQQPLLLRTCQLHPRAQSTATCEPLQHMFPLHPSPTGWPKRPQSPTFQRRLRPLGVAPRGDFPEPHLCRASGHVSCPSPLVQPKSVHPIPHTSQLCKMPGSLGRPTYPIDIVLIRMALLTADAAEHAMPSHPQFSKFLAPGRPAAAAPQNTASNRGVEQLQPPPDRHSTV